MMPLWPLSRGAAIEAVFVAYIATANDFQLIPQCGKRHGAASSAERTGPAPCHRERRIKLPYGSSIEIRTLPQWQLPLRVSAMVSASAMAPA